MWTFAKNSELFWTAHIIAGAIVIGAFFVVWRKWVTLSRIIIVRLKNEDKCSPGDTCSASCTGKKGEDGWEKYAKNHGGSLKIDINNGDFVFIYS